MVDHGITKSRCLFGFLGLAVVLLGCFSGCTTDPYTGESKVSKTAMSAAVGAALGAATSSKSDRKKGVVIGAAVGGSIGAYMDHQESKLRQRLAGTGVSVTREGENIRLNMPGHLTFEVDRSDIRPQFYDVLQSVALVLNEFDKTQVKVAGHTDSTGSDAYNQQLSVTRASSVVRYLSSQGVHAGRFYTVGYGESSPIADNATADGRQRNRRVEVNIVPSGSGI